MEIDSNQDYSNWRVKLFLKKANINFFFKCKYKNHCKFKSLQNLSEIFPF